MTRRATRTLSASTTVPATALPPALWPQLCAYIAADMDAFGRDVAFASDLHVYAACALADVAPAEIVLREVAATALASLLVLTYHACGFKTLRARVADAREIENGYYLPALLQAVQVRGARSFSFLLG